MKITSHITSRIFLNDPRERLDETGAENSEEPLTETNDRQTKHQSFTEALELNHAGHQNYYAIDLPQPQR